MRRIYSLVMLFVVTLVPALAATYKVDDGGPAAINAALAQAKPGDTVALAEGLYYVPEGISIRTDKLVFSGAGADRTVLDGRGEAYAVVRAEAKGVVITGFTLRRGSSHGIYVNSENWARIHHNVVANNGDRGILLGSGNPYAVIDHNTFANNSVSAVYSYVDEPKTKVTNNIFARNSRSLVVDKDESRMTVKYNCFWDQSNDSQWVKKHSTNIRKDPAFLDPSHDYHLVDGSPCLGKGESRTNIGALGKGQNPRLAEPEPDVVKDDFSTYHVVILTYDTELGDQVLDALKEAGFTNEDNYVAEDDGSLETVTYGSAGEGAIAKIKQVVLDVADVELEEDNSFDLDDDDIYIYLP